MFEGSFHIYHLPMKGKQFDVVVHICRVNSRTKTRLLLIFSCVDISADRLCLRRCLHVIQSEINVFCISLNMQLNENIFNIL
jgi:hypothetical protein